MNYCKKLRFRIFTTEENTFETMVDDLLDRLPGKEKVLRLTFFGAPRMLKSFLNMRNGIGEAVEKRFGDSVPALSFVAQPPLNAALAMEVHSLAANKTDRLVYGRCGAARYVIVENSEGRFLYAGGFQSPGLGEENMEEQSDSVFSQMGELLERTSFPIDSIVRQWNYIEDITKSDRKGGQHYQMFNNARSRFYARTEWTSGYPAATGIGMHTGGILVDFDAALFKAPFSFASPVDNPLQTAAHNYSDEVLHTANNLKTTPKFERAKRLKFGIDSLLYISGTAAIRGEESLKKAPLHEQLFATMENIDWLLDHARLKMLRVYLKNPEDATMAGRLLDVLARRVPKLYMKADICRKELLIEIEGIATEP